MAKQAEAAIDRNLRAAIASALANCWLGLRLELLGATLAALAALLAFARRGGGAAAAAVHAAAGSAADAAVCAAAEWTLGAAADAAVCVATDAAGSAAVAGATAAANAAAAASSARRVGRTALSVSLAMQVTQALNWSVRQVTELEAHLVAVERLRSYRDVPAEPGYVQDGAQDDVPQTGHRRASARAEGPAEMAMADGAAAAAATAAAAGGLAPGGPTARARPTRAPSQAPRAGASSWRT